MVKKSPPACPHSPGAIEARAAPVAVFTALAWESAAVRAHLRYVRRQHKGVWRAVAGQRTIHVITSGLGIHRTQETLRRFIDTPFSAIVSVGCAGALLPALTTGQLILAPEVYMRSMASEDRIERFPLDTGLLAHARMAAARAAVPVAEGPLLTSVVPLLTPEEKLRQGEATGAIAVEMESGAHAAFAQARGLPFLALRIILDSVDMALPVTAGLITSNGTVRPLRAAAYVATHPRHVPLFLTLKRAQAVVAQTLSRLCSALFPLL